MPGTAAECAPRRADAPSEAIDVLVERLEVLLAQGELTAAVAVGQELAPLLDLPGSEGARAHLVTGELAAALGDAEAALDHFRTAGDLDPDAGPDRLPWRSGAALALLRSGDGRTAADLARIEVELSTETGSARALAMSLRTLAAVDTGTGRIQLLLRARAVLADQPPDRLSAQIATDLAGLLSLSPDPEVRLRALALLREVETQAAGQELWPLHSRVRRLLDRLGERPQRVESEALALLTRSEQRVAQLAAAGLTNKQIAAELFVTVKAVEWHLSHVYRKLGISSRTHLPASLGAA